ncbi:hypothetical protein NEIPOLOT_00688 [Neisseria polysaccharea ATCC 43768]|nr:hypothetical protein NEIPOLOT_00688 [Neisseria polysaccharea ATCC 43768]
MPQRKIAGLPVKSAVCPGAAGALGFRRHIFGFSEWRHFCRRSGSRMEKGGDIVVGNGKKYAAPLLVLGCVVFGLGSLIVRSVPVDPYAIAFWRLLISVFVFWFLARFFGQKIPKKQENRLLCPDGGRVSCFRFGVVARKHTRGRAGYFHPAQQPANLFLVGNRCFLF